jgi:hypothetical protein
MRKAQLRQEVAEYLASVGYAHGNYAWARAGRKVVCRVLTTPNAALMLSADSPTASCWIDLPLPAGTSRKAMHELLATVPTIGSPRAVKAWAEPASAVQTTMRPQ